MADTIRQKILDNIVATLDAIPELEGETEVNTPDVIDFETAVFPKAFIDSGDEEENLEEHTTESEAWVWRPIVSVYFRVPDPRENREPEKFLGLVHSALCADRSRGGYADETARLTCDILELDSDGGLIQGIFMIWEIKYTHIDGNPYSQESGF